MSRFIKRILLGLIIWVIPFLAGVFVWDSVAGAPKIGLSWFSALMAITWAIGFAIAAGVYFKDIRKDPVREGWITGITWYIQLLIIDLIVLVGLFGMGIGDWYPMLLTYINSVALCVAIGYIKK